jgi:hypothetical protein
MSERRNVPEIAIGFRELLRRPKLGSSSSLRCQKSRTRVRWDATCEVMFSRTMFRLQSARLRSSSYAGHASIAMPAAPRIAKGEAWWSQTGSNRRPHACKARALPAELWPRTRRRLHLLRSPSLELRRSSLLREGLPGRSAEREGWWAWEDLNFRPHAYQARALTN